MPMTAFLLQDIPPDVAAYATRTARSSRRDMNGVLVDMLVRAASQDPAAAAPAPALTSVPAAVAPTTAASAPVPALVPLAANALPDGTARDESLAVREAMQAAQSIPTG